MPKGACVPVGVAKTCCEGGGGWYSTVPKETEVVGLGREELATLDCDHAGDQPPAPSKQTQKCLTWMTLCMSRSDGMGCSTAARSACDEVGASPSRRCCS